MQSEGQPQQALAASKAGSTPKKKRKPAEKGVALPEVPPTAAALQEGTPQWVAPAVVLLPHDHAAIIGWHSLDGSIATVGKHPIRLLPGCCNAAVPLTGEAGAGCSRAREIIPHTCGCLDSCGSADCE